MLQLKCIFNIKGITCLLHYKSSCFSIYKKTLLLSHSSKCFTSHRFLKESEESEENIITFCYQNSKTHIQNWIYWSNPWAEHFSKTNILNSLVTFIQGRKNTPLLLVSCIAHVSAHFCVSLFNPEMSEIWYEDRF